MTARDSRPLVPPGRPTSIRHPVPKPVHRKWHVRPGHRGADAATLIVVETALHMGKN